MRVGHVTSKQTSCKFGHNELPFAQSSRRLFSRGYRLTCTIHPMLVIVFVQWDACTLFIFVQHLCCSNILWVVWARSARINAGTQSSPATPKKDSMAQQQLHSFVVVSSAQIVTSQNVSSLISHFLPGQLYLLQSHPVSSSKPPNPPDVLIEYSHRTHQESEWRELICLSLLSNLVWNEYKMNPSQHNYKQHFAWTLVQKRGATILRRSENFYSLKCSKIWSVNAKVDRFFSKTDEVFSWLGWNSGKCLVAIWKSPCLYKLVE